MEIGEEKFTRLGLRKTTIDDLAGGAQIGKGSFYQFFESKEDLFLAIQYDIEARVSDRFQERLNGLQTDPPRMVRCFFETCIELLEKHPFLKQLSDPQVMPLLARSVPPQRMETMRQQNIDLYREMFATWVESGVVRGVDADTLYGLLTAIFVLQQNKDAFDGRSDAVMSWLVDSICAQADAGQRA